MEAHCPTHHIIDTPPAPSASYEEIVRRFEIPFDNVDCAPTDVTPNTATNFFDPATSVNNFFGFTVQRITKLKDATFCSKHNSSLMLKTFPAGFEPQKELVLTAAAMKSPNILPIICSSSTGSSTCFVVPRPHRTIDELPRPSTVVEFGRRIQQLHQVVDAILHLDEKCKVAHLNIAPHNIFIFGDDLGDARLTGSKTHQQQKDTPEPNFGYVAPELVLGTCADAIECYRMCDVFSLGVVMNQVISGKSKTSVRPGKPRRGAPSGRRQQVSELAEGLFAPAKCVLPTCVASIKSCVALRDIVDRCGSFDPARRPTLKIIKDTLVAIESDPEISNPLLLNALSSFEKHDPGNATLLIKGMTSLTHQISRLNRRDELRDLEMASLKKKMEENDANLKRLVELNVAPLRSCYSKLQQEMKDLEERVNFGAGRIDVIENAHTIRLENPNDGAVEKAKEIIAGLPHPKSISKLYVSDSSVKITDATLELLSEFTNLRWVHLSGCQEITDDGLAKLPSSVTHINLSGGSKIRSVKLAHLKNLSTLNLSGCSGIGDGTVVGALAPLPSLTSLGLGGCRSVTDQGLDRISGSFSSLTSLNLTNCCEISADSFAKIVQLNNLRLLNVGGCQNLDSITKDKLKKLLPNLEIRA